MCRLTEGDLRWKEANLLAKLEQVREQLVARGDKPMDGPVVLVGIAEDDPRWTEQAILQKLSEVRAEIAEHETQGQAQPALAATEPQAEEPVLTSPPVPAEPASLPPAQGAASSASDAILRRAVGAAPAWVMTVQSPMLTVIEANPACEALFGGDVVGQTLPALLAQGETTLPERIREAMETGRSATVEHLTVSMLSGEYAEKRHWSFFLFPWAFDEEAQGRVLVVGVDITSTVHERHWAEASAASRLVEAIEADQAQLEAVLRHVPLAVAVIDAASGEVLFDCNLDPGLRVRAFPAGLPARAVPTGWTRTDSSPLTDATWPVNRVLRGETLHHELVRLTRSDGGYRTFRVSGGPIFSPTGQITSAAIVWDEVTLQVAGDAQVEQLQAQVASRDALLQEVMEASAVGMVVHSCDGTPPRANTHVTGLVGPDLSPTRPLLRPDGRPLPPEDLPLARALNGEVVIDEQAQRIGTTGKPVEMRLAARPVRDASGNISHAIATYQDVSPQPGVNEFLANLSHELRTPMTSILGWIRLLSDGQLSPEKRAHGLAVIERNARLQMHLIEDLLDTSLILSGRLPLDPRPINPRLVVEQVMESVLPLGSLKGVALSARVAPECTEVTLDPDRLHQVIWNLLANAIRFTGENGTVSLRVGQAAGKIKIEVQDTGEGIEPEVLPYVFRRFAPSDSATSRRLGGLGMGLALMKHLVDLQGGTIEAFSAGVGQGSTFVVTLPTTPAIEQVPEAPAGMGVAGRRSFPNLAGRTVLVVEDESDTRDLLRAVLQGTAAKVVTANDGVDALKQMQGNTVDLVVSDLGMPERDGYDLIRLIRLAEGSGYRLPAVALTARTRDEDRSRALAAGFDVHLAKPVDPRKLINLVASLLAATRSPGPGELRN